MNAKDLVCEKEEQVKLSDLLLEGEAEQPEAGKEEEKEEKEEGNEEKPTDSSEQDDNAPKPFAQLDLREASCFGWERDPKQKCWYNKCLHAKTVGWKNADVQGIQESLKNNVDACYFYLANFYFVDVEDEMRWHAFFDNSKGLWRLEIQDSPKAELESQQYADFFGSDMMKKTANRAYDLIKRAEKEFNETLKVHMDNAELLEVDEVKLEAELHFINDSLLMENLKSCKWVQ